MNKRVPFELLWRWMLGLVLGSIALGMVLTALPGTGALGWYDEGMLAPFGGADANESLLQQYRFLMGLVGAAVVGWAVTMAFIVAGPFRRKEPWAWWSLALGIAAWIGVEALVCIVWGVTAELVFLACAAVGIGIPMALSKPHFGA